MKIEKFLVICVIILGVLFVANIFGVFDGLKTTNDKLYSKKEVALMWAIKERDQKIKNLKKEIKQIHIENENIWKKFNVDSSAIYNGSDEFLDSLRAIYNPR